MLQDPQLSRLLAAFPKTQATAVTRACARIELGIHPPTAPCIGPVIVDGEPLAIPHRVYFAEPDESVILPESESRVRSCLFSRHHDGHVRSRQVPKLLKEETSWVVPYVVQLLGEYVVEICEVIAAHLAGLNRGIYGAFLRENPSFVALTYARATSYWDCYYRSYWQARHWSRDEYPALRALAEMRSWA